ncbi:hypothetical protein [Lewinella sp. LCG006]|uniref:hypothetical protein n=1 Tax=Lewinella sp. LCG006 TaxID=3231911 RepID=UPI0034602F39
MIILCISKWLLITVFPYFSISPNTFGEIEKYGKAYEYVLTKEDEIDRIRLLFEGFSFEVNREAFCIDTLAQPLTISGFHEVNDEDQRKSIRVAKIAPMPYVIKQLSHCEKHPAFNMTFSVINGDFLTLELSSRELNPLGGNSQGPSIKWLFEFDKQNTIVSVLCQTYVNG